MGAESVGVADDLRAELAESLPDAKKQEEVYRRQLVGYQQGVVDLLAQIEVQEAQTPEPGELDGWKQRIAALATQARNASAAVARLKERIAALQG